MPDLSILEMQCGACKTYCTAPEPINQSYLEFQKMKTLSFDTNPKILDDVTKELRNMTEVEKTDYNNSISQTIDKEILELSSKYQNKCTFSTTIIQNGVKTDYEIKRDPVYAISEIKDSQITLKCPICETILFRHSPAKIIKVTK